jgi:hypothetical protein
VGPYECQGLFLAHVHHYKNDVIKYVDAQRTLNCVPRLIKLNFNLFDLLYLLFPFTKNIVKQKWLVGSKTRTTKIK